MTDKDYEELKARLLEEGLLIKTSKAKQHEYFREFNDYMNGLYKGNDHDMTGYGTLDAAVKNTLRWAYNSKTIQRMPDERRDGECIEGKVTSWKDFEDGDQIQVVIDGVTYLTDTTRCVLIKR